MTNFTIGRWLLVSLALIGLVLATPAVSAHGNDTAADTAADDHPGATPAADWAEWMESHTIEHMGPGSVEWMESHMGVTVDEMARDVADDDYDGGRYGQGHC